MLLRDIQEASVAARKARQTQRAEVLVTLFAEAQRKGKDDGNRESTDDEVVAVVKKFVKIIDEFLAATKDEAKRQALSAERDIVSEFLPKQADEATLRETVAGLVAQLPEKTPKLMGQVMSQLKTALQGNYDGALASRLVREALAAA